MRRVLVEFLRERVVAAAMAVLAAGAVQRAGRASDAAASVEESALPRGRVVAEQLDPADIIRKRRKPTMSNVETFQVNLISVGANRERNPRLTFARPAGPRSGPPARTSASCRSNSIQGYRAAANNS